MCGIDNGNKTMLIANVICCYLNKNTHFNTSQSVSKTCRMPELSVAARYALLMDRVAMF